ncbi:MAG: GNAT family N-acetyltransferase [Paracoccaceae bacterium]
MLQRCYPVVLAPDYPADVLAAALPGMTRAKPALLTSGSYFVTEGALGRIVAAGGWTRGAPGNGVMQGATGHIRHVASDPDLLRQGLGRRLMQAVMADAKATGIVRLECLSTRTAEPFYANMGFLSVGPVDVMLGSGVVFPAVLMLADLTG